MITGVLLLTIVIAVIGLLLMLADRRLAHRGTRDLERIEALLPHTQCAQCGYPGCRPYAEALLAGEAGVNQCPPGGEATARALAALLGETAGGRVTPAPPPGSEVAVIDEGRCVGCFRCREVCPVDAIVGGPRYRHTVIAAVCTGCALCIPACPVDCITLVPNADARSHPQGVPS